MENVAILAGLALMHLLGAMTPGPNLLMVSYLAVGRSRRAGLLAAGGIALGSLLWVSLSLAGVGLILQEVGWLYRLLRWLGAAYLVFFGARLLLTAFRGRLESAAAAMPPPAAKPQRPPFLLGLLTNLGNPKSAVFWTSLFVVAVPPDAGIGFYGAILAIVAIQAAGWYGLVALVLSSGHAGRLYGRLGRWLDGLTGAAMLAFGIKLASER